MAKFTSKHTPRQLVEFVRVGLLAVRPEDPLSVLQREFDAEREDAGIPEAPTADAICRRLKLKWEQLREIAMGDPATMQQRLRLRQSDRGRKGITLDQVCIALRQAAALVSKSGIDRSDYQVAQAASRGPGRRPLPELNQIEAVLRKNELDWDAGLAAAGLTQPEKVKPRVGLTNQQAVELFVQCTGQLPPSVRQLLRWSTENQVSVARQLQGDPETFERVVADIVAAREQAGQAPLTVAKPNSPLPGVPDELRGELPIKAREWTRETLLDGMALAVPHLHVGESLGQRSLKRIASENPNEPIPSYSPVARAIAKLSKTNPAETFEAWCAEAERRAASS